MKTFLFAMLNRNVGGTLMELIVIANFPISSFIISLQYWLQYKLYLYIMYKWSIIRRHNVDGFETGLITDFRWYLTQKYYQSTTNKPNSHLIFWTHLINLKLQYSWVDFSYILFQINTFHDVFDVAITIKSLVLYREGTLHQLLTDKYWMICLNIRVTPKEITIQHKENIAMKVFILLNHYAIPGSYIHYLIVTIFQNVTIRSVSLIIEYIVALGKFCSYSQHTLDKYQDDKTIIEIWINTNSKWWCTITVNTCNKFYPKFNVITNDSLRQSHLSLIAISFDQLYFTKETVFTVVRMRCDINEVLILKG